LQISPAKTKNYLESELLVKQEWGNFLWSAEGGFAFEICDSFGYFSYKEK